MVNNRNDFPFLADQTKGNIVFNLSRRTYNILRVMANMTYQQDFNNKQEILDLLKGKSRKELFAIRTIGENTFKELKQWVEKELEGKI